MPANVNGREKTWNGGLTRKNARRRKELVSQEENNCAERMDVNLKATVMDRQAAKDGRRMVGDKKQQQNDF